MYIYITQLNNNDVVGDASIWEVLDHDFWGQDIHQPDSHKSFRPITTLSYRLNYAAHGIEGWSYHLANNFIYSLVVVCVYYFVFECTNNRTISMLTSFLYLIHPTHVESVASLVGRADSLCSFFYLLGLICYCKCIKHDRVVNKPNPNHQSTPQVSTGYIAYLTSAILLALLASFSKEIGATSFVYFGYLDFIHQLDEEFKTEKKRRERRGEKHQDSSNDPQGDCFDFSTVLKVVWEAVLHYLPSYIHDEKPAISNSNSNINRNSNNAQKSPTGTVYVEKPSSNSKTTYHTSYYADSYADDGMSAT